MTMNSYYYKKLFTDEVLLQNMLRERDIIFFLHQWQYFLKTEMDCNPIIWFLLVLIELFM
jgi:hypothetical protein